MSNIKHRHATSEATEEVVQRRSKPGADTHTGSLANALSRQVQMRSGSPAWNPPTETHEHIGDGWAVQRREGDAARASTAASAADASASVHAAAAHATSGSSGALPFFDQIQASFGPAHDLSGVKAHTDAAASQGSAAMGAEAFASGDRVAFAGAPSLHTAAHEAAHIVQQRDGVHLKGGVGEAGDAYERHADAVADRVVQGASAADLLPGAALQTGSATTVQRKGADEADATAGMSVEYGIDREIRGTLLIASKVASTMRQRVEAGGMGADAGCLEIASQVRAALDAMNRYVTARLSRGMTETADQAEHRKSIERYLEVLVSSCLHLVAKARADGGTGAAPPVGAPTLASLSQQLLAVAPVAGFMIPQSVDEIDSRVAAQNACPPGSAMAGVPGCNDDAGRDDLRGKVRVQLARAGGAFFEECKQAAAELEASLAKDARWAEIVTDVLVATLITFGGGAAGAALGGGAAAANEASGAATIANDLKTGGAAAKGVAATATGEAAKEGSRGIEGFKDALKDLAKSSATTIIPSEEVAKGGDPRAGTITMIEKLGNDVVTALQNLADSGLERLSDEALERLNANLSGSTDPYKEAARTFIAKYRQQIEPLGNVDYKDPFMKYGPGLVASPVAGTVSAWVTGGPAPRLAVLKERGVTTQNTMTGALPGDVALADYEFISWVDPSFVATVAPQTTMTLPQDKITGVSSQAKGAEP